MAGENSTTEPPMLGNTGRDILYNHIFVVRIFPLCAHFSLLFFDNNFAQFLCADNKLHQPGIEPVSIAWQATILPLNHRSLAILVWTYCIIIYFSLRAHFPLCARFSLRARFCLRVGFCLRARFSLLFSDNNLRIFCAQIISCIGREWKPCLSLGRRQPYQ